MFVFGVEVLSRVVFSHFLSLVVFFYSLAYGGNAPRSSFCGLFFVVPAVAVFEFSCCFSLPCYCVMAVVGGCDRPFFQEPPGRYPSLIPFSLLRSGFRFLHFLIDGQGRALSGRVAAHFRARVPFRGCVAAVCEVSCFCVCAR